GADRRAVLPVRLPALRRVRRQGAVGDAQTVRRSRRETGRGQLRMAKPIAVLFDIDETLVHTGGAGARSWAWAFDQLYGVPADIGQHTSAGETDPQVGRETFRAVLHRD